MLSALPIASDRNSPSKQGLDNETEEVEERLRRLEVHTSTTPDASFVSRRWLRCFCSTNDPSLFSADFAPVLFLLFLDDGGDGGTSRGAASALRRDIKSDTDIDTLATRSKKRRK